MGEIISIIIAILIYLMFAKYINYIISLISLILPSNILLLFLFAISILVILFVIHRK